MSRSILIALVAVIVGCASKTGTPHIHELRGLRHVEDFIWNYGCEPDSVFAASERYAEEIGNQRIQPEVGWTSCELMARNGKPGEVNRSVGTDGTEYATFVYERSCAGQRLLYGAMADCPSEIGRVRLRFEDPEKRIWIVEDVEW